MATLNLLITSGANDAFENDVEDVSTTTTAAISDQPFELLAFRFVNVTIPQGATINSAALQVYITSSALDEPAHTIFCDDADNSAAFTAGSANGDISARTRTTATIDWTSTDLGSSGGLFTAPDITTAVQEVINRGGWVSGNALTVIIDSQGLGATRDLGVDFYDLNSNRAAHLDIDYTSGNTYTETGSGGSLGGSTATESIVYSIVSDDFNRANANPISASAQGWTWTEVAGTNAKIASNVVAGDAPTIVRAEADLISSDMSVSIDITGGGNNSSFGVFARFSAAAETGYLFMITYATVAGQNDVVRILRRTAGNDVNLASLQRSVPSYPFNMIAVVSGSSLELRIADEVWIPAITDSNITSNTRSGLYLTFSDSTGDNYVVTANVPITSFSKTGATFPGTVVSDNSVGTKAWSNPSNVTSSNDTYATATIGTNDASSTEYLWCTNFGFNIPSTATITGVIASIERKSSGSSATERAGDKVLKLVKSGSVVGDSQCSDISLGYVGHELWGQFSDTTSFFGGAENLWGTTLTPSDVNASNFGVAFQAYILTNNITASIDGITLNVYYTDTDRIASGGSVAGETAVPTLIRNTTLSGGAVAGGTANLHIVGAVGGGIALVGTDWFVSPTGNSGNTGKINSPWDLDSALINQSGDILPGDTLNLRVGTYYFANRSAGNYGYVINLVGEPGNYITVKPYLNERARIDGGLTDDNINGPQYVIVKNLEIFVSENLTETRHSEFTGSDAPDDLIRPWGGCDFTAAYSFKLVNNVIHDNMQGVGWWTGVRGGSEFYGNIVYNNGWLADDRNHGHGLYTQNLGAGEDWKYIHRNIFINNFSYNIHNYGSEFAYCNFYDYRENVAITGDISDNGGMLVFGTGNAADNGNFIDNYCEAGQQLGYKDGPPYGNDIVCTGNINWGGLAIKTPIDGWTNLTKIDNIWNAAFVLPRTEDFDGDWIGVSIPVPSDAAVMLTSNAYDETRFQLSVFNYNADPSVDVDVSEMFSIGESYAIMDPMDMWGDPVAEGEYTGTDITVPLDGELVNAFILFNNGISPDVSGGASAGGRAIVPFTPIPSGGSLAGGLASVPFIYTNVPSGGVRCAGTARISSGEASGLRPSDADGDSDWRWKWQWQWQWKWRWK